MREYGNLMLLRIPVGNSKYESEEHMHAVL